MACRLFSIDLAFGSHLCVPSSRVRALVVYKYRCNLIVVVLGFPSASKSSELFLECFCHPHLLVICDSARGIYEGFPYFATRRPMSFNHYFIRL